METNDIPPELRGPEPTPTPDSTKPMPEGPEGKPGKVEVKARKSDRSCVEIFKDVTAGLQSLAVVAATILGACWTYYAFRSLAQEEKAQTELADLKAKVHSIVIEVRLDAKLHKVANEQQARYISAVATITNKGNSHTILKLSEPLTVIPTKIGTEVELAPALAKRYPAVSSKKENEYKIYGLVMRPGETQRVPFIVKVSGPGTYYLDFLVEVDENDPNIRHVPKEQRPVFWGEAAYVIVD